MSVSRSRRQGRVTLVDVANAAGVSKTAASAALNRSGRVADATAERVRQVAQELNYVPNTAGQNLRRERVGAVGLVLPDDVSGLAFYMEFTFGVADVFKELDLSLLLLPKNTASGLAIRHVDGFIVVDARDSDEQIGQILEHGFLVVTGERVSSALGTPDGIVESDHVGGMTALLNHLETHGARRPAFLAPGADYAWGRALRQGYEPWCADRGIAPIIREVPFGPADQEAQTACTEILTEHPDVDALVCGSDHIAAIAAASANAAGFSVGDDLFVASCVDSALVQLAQPSITALDLNPRDLGGRCARLFVKLLEAGDPEAEPVLETSPVELHARRSTAGHLRYRASSTI